MSNALDTLRSDNSYAVSLRDHGIPLSINRMAAWLNQPAKVEGFLEFVGGGGSIVVYARNNGLSYLALKLFLSDIAEGRTKALVEAARSDALKERAAELIEGKEFIGDGRKRVFDANIALAKMENPAAYSPKTTNNTNVQLNVGMAELHGQIQERRRLAAQVTVSNGKVDVKVLTAADLGLD